MVSTLAFIHEESIGSIWMITCASGGVVFIAVGARAAGLALLGAVVGGIVGLGLVASNLDQLPHGAMVGATVGTFVAGLVGLAWRSRASTSVLCVLGSATIVVGVVAGWAASSQVCDAYRHTRCLADVDAGSLALFALDAAWIAALCFIQGARFEVARRDRAAGAEGPSRDIAEPRAPERHVALTAA